MFPNKDVTQLPKYIKRPDKTKDAPKDSTIALPRAAGTRSRSPDFFKRTTYPAPIFPTINDIIPTIICALEKYTEYTPKTPTLTTDSITVTDRYITVLIRNVSHTGTTIFQQRILCAISLLADKAENTSTS